MATKFLIIPSPGDNWQDISLDFHIDIRHFRDGLTEKWQIIVPNSYESKDHDFEWRFMPDGALWCVYFDRRVIRFYWDDFARDFILWYRTYIPRNQRLFLIFEGGGHIELTGTVNGEELENFARGG